MSERVRCFGNGKGKEFYAKYHDKEWGVPVFDDRHLFEMLTLEGAQAGLSWETILKRRDGYKKLFHDFNVEKVAKMSDMDLEAILKDPSVIRNRLKIFSVRQNAKVFLEIQKEFGSFSKYLWGFVDNQRIINHWKSLSDIPTRSPLSDKISKDLKKRGMKFVGTTIIYAYLQAVGLVDDHILSCHIRQNEHVLKD